MFRKKQDYLLPHEIEMTVESYRSKLPYFMIHELNARLKERKLTKPQLERILQDIAEETKGREINNKVTELKDNLSKLEEGLKKIQGLVGVKEEIREKFPTDRMGSIEKRIQNVSNQIEATVAENNQIFSNLDRKIDRIKEESRAPVKEEKMKKLDTKVDTLLGDVKELSKDVSAILIGIDLKEILSEELEEKK
jgi:uncharacterized phage infection (PIP) family protein YhgE